MAESDAKQLVSQIKNLLTSHNKLSFSVKLAKRGRKHDHVRMTARTTFNGKVRFYEGESVISAKSLIENLSTIYSHTAQEEIMLALLKAA